LLLNIKIGTDKNLGEGFRIGHSYFCPKPGVKTDKDWFRNIILAEIEPLLSEYWFDNTDIKKEAIKNLLA
jgi:5-methylcytosine-specific restriction protein B